MKQVDYLIVGFGIAGACFAKKCLENNRSFQVVSDIQGSASHTAAGMFNPVILHRFNPVFKAEEQMLQLKKTFKEFEDLIKQKFVHEIPVYRIFASADERRIWKEKISQDLILQKFLNPEIIEGEFPNIYSPYGFGEVTDSGWIDMSGILHSFGEMIAENIQHESFDYAEFNPENKTYGIIQFQKIIFAEGVKVENNPYFSYLPVIKNKGETLIIETNAELPEIIIKSKNFLMPLGGRRWYVGATYEREAQTAEPTADNRQKLQDDLSVYFNGEYRIVEQRAAFRPTTPDRRGIIGAHPEFPDIFVLNGMGTRGTFHAPYLSEMLFAHTEFDQNIAEEFDVKRWNKRYLKSLSENGSTHP